MFSCRVIGSLCFNCMTVVCYWFIGKGLVHLQYVVCTSYVYYLVSFTSHVAPCLSLYCCFNWLELVMCHEPSCQQSGQVRRGGGLDYPQTNQTTWSPPIL